MFWVWQVELYHIVDEMLLKLAIAEGRLSPFIYRRAADHVIAADEAGADVVMFTCSSISPCVDVARPMVDVPVLKVDEPMVDKALSIGTTIGVAATLRSTLGPTTELVKTRAEMMSTQVEIHSVLGEGAFEALGAGDKQAHDRIVRDTLKGLMANSDVVVLAQASMARVLDTIPPDEQPVPVLSSPRLAVERVRDVIAELGE